MSSKKLESPLNAFTKLFKYCISIDLCKDNLWHKYSEKEKGPEASDADVRRWLRRHGPERLSPIARIELADVRDDADRAGEVVAAWRRARAVRRAGPPLEIGDLAIDGRTLMRLGLKPGPAFGTILEGLLDRVIEDPALNEVSWLEEEARRLGAEVPDADRPLSSPDGGAAHE